MHLFPPSLTCSDVSLLAVLLLAGSIAAVSADYKLELQLVRYLNPTHRLESGRCCDMDHGVRDCVDHCDNSLHFCLSSPSERVSCSLGEIQTGLLYSPDSDAVNFSTGGVLIAESVQNPLVFTGAEWPGGFEMVVTVEDMDEGEESETVDVLVVSKLTGITPTTDRYTSAEEVRGNAGRGFLRFNFRLTCTNNYTGGKCTKLLCSTEQCSGAIPADILCSDGPCENGGVCIRTPDMEAGYMCSCPLPFVGSRCELMSQPTTTTIPHLTPTAMAPVSSEGRPKTNSGRDVAVAVATCGLFLVLFGLLVVFVAWGIHCQRHRGMQWFGKIKREKREDSGEDGMYDNPSYNGCSAEPDTVAYEQPKTSSSGAECNLTLTEDDTTYHTVLNPLYLEPMTCSQHSTSLQPHGEHTTLDQEPYYATPTFPSSQSHTTNMYLSPRVVATPHNTS